MFDRIRKKLREWQRENRWVPADTCSYKFMTIYMYALNPNESLTQPIVLNKDDGVRGGRLEIDTTELAKIIGEKEAMQEAKNFVARLQPEFEQQNLLYLGLSEDKDNPKILRLHMNNRLYTTRMNTINRMKSVIYPLMTNAEQKAAGEESTWDENRANILDQKHADLLNQYRKVIPPEQLESFIDQELKKAEQEYDRQYPNDGRTR